MPLLSLSLDMEWCLNMNCALDWGMRHALCKQGVCAGEVYPNIRIILHIIEILFCMKYCMIPLNQPLCQALTPVILSKMRCCPGREIWTSETGTWRR